MINKVLLTGRLTSNIELRQTNDGIVFSYFTLAVQRMSSKNETDFISCVTWRKTAEFMRDYLKKGSLIGVEGRLEVYRLEQDGNYQTRTNVNVSQVHFLESKQQNIDQSTENVFNTNTIQKNNFNNKNFDKEQDEMKMEDIDFDEIDF
ncbi:MAG: hypothetical protein HPAVJP_0220 [Candidatus Hepatoplasma vulgare]|nr:MAG: hypothetical protein HPAVJP_0220 [Candidatus Hepatoplasma sp.]